MSRLIPVVAGALIRSGHEILLAQRPSHKNMGGLWEFPGGKIELSETPEAALIRELYEELNIQVDLHELKPLTFVSHGYDSFHLLMMIYTIYDWKGEPKANEHSALAWVPASQLSDYPMPPADIPLIATLQQYLRGNNPLHPKATL